jgi:hypothetical protein
MGFDSVVKGEHDEFVRDWLSGCAQRRQTAEQKQGDNEEAADGGDWQRRKMSAREMEFHVC